MAIPNLNYSSFDLMGLLRKTMRMNFENDRWFIKNCLSESLFIEGDEFILRNAFSEIIANSKTMVEDPDQLLMFIQIDNRNGHEFITISIKDNGPGIPEKIKQRIFNDFYTHRPGKKSGIGLGLGYVKRVIHSHNGGIEERGVEGKGANFIITLPIRRNYGKERH